jgi:hypothetical protein
MNVGNMVTPSADHRQSKSFEYIGSLRANFMRETRALVVLHFARTSNSIARLVNRRLATVSAVLCVQRPRLGDQISNGVCTQTRRVILQLKPFLRRVFPLTL